MNNFMVVDIKTGFEMQPYTAIQEGAYEHIYEEELKRKEVIDLKFSEENHRYELNGVVIPSVTKILQEVKLADFSMIPPARLEAACLFGTAVHKACELFDKSMLDERTIDPALWSYLDGWVSFKKDYALDFIDIEKPIVSTIYRVAGTPDRIAKSDKRRRLAVLLNDEGTYKVTEYKDKNDWQVFLSCLSVVNWKARNK